MSSMQLDEPLEAPANPTPRRYRCFPIRLCSCIPIVPRAWAVVADYTHLTLLCGVLAGLSLIIDRFVSFWYVDCWQRDHGYCLSESISIFVVFPFIVYMFGIINQYDDRIVSKQRLVAAKNEELKEDYQGLVRDMEDLLHKAVESSIVSVENQCNSHRVSFVNFLRYVIHNPERFGGPIADPDEYKRFFNFLMAWLHVYQEVSPDPIKYPMRVVRDDELRSFTSIVDAANLLVTKLKDTPASFVQDQKADDDKMLGRMLEINRAHSTFSASASFLLAERDLSRDDRLCPCHWLSFGCKGCGCNRAEGKLFPQVFRFCCGRLRILSREHWLLLAYFNVGIAILVLEVVQAYQMPKRRNFIDVILDGVIIVCLIVLLIRFEELDTLYQLERETIKLDREKTWVENHLEKTRAFWNNSDVLVDLWMHRTLPLLELLHTFHNHLKDCDLHQVASVMDIVDIGFRKLEEELGSLEEWCNRDEIHCEQKKQHGARLHDLCSAPDLASLHAALGNEAVPLSRMSTAAPRESTPTNVGLATFLRLDDEPDIEEQERGRLAGTAHVTEALQTSHSADSGKQNQPGKATSPSSRPTRLLRQDTLKEAEDQARLSCFLRDNSFSSVNAKQSGSMLIRYPIHVAVKQDRADMVRLLLTQRANPSLPNYMNNTPLQLATSLNQSKGTHVDVLQELTKTRS